MRLSEKYRPTSLDAVVGQDKAVAVARTLMSKGIGGGAVWISGPTGTGKTTIARILADSIAEKTFITECAADDVGAEWFDYFRATAGMFGWGRGGRVWIINEAHGLRAGTIRKLLELLETLPPHVSIIFTTTLAGEDFLFDGQQDAGPLLHRCAPVRLTSQGVSKPFAAVLARIAREEGFGELAESRAARIVQDAKNSMRGAIAALETSMVGGGA